MGGFPTSTAGCGSTSAAPPNGKKARSFTSGSMLRAVKVVTYGIVVNERVWKRQTPISRGRGEIAISNLYRKPPIFRDLGRQQCARFTPANTLLFDCYCGSNTLIGSKIFVDLPTGVLRIII
jgi:hypothetical protein